MRAFLVLASVVALVSGHGFVKTTTGYGGSGLSDYYGSGYTGSGFGGSYGVGSTYGSGGFGSSGSSFGNSGYKSGFGGNYGTISYDTGKTSYGTSGFGSHHGGSGFGSRHGSSGLLTGHVGSGFGGSSYGVLNSGYGGGVNSGFGTGHGFGGHYKDSTYAGGFGHSHTTVVKQTAPLVTKASYVFAAPEDHENFQHDQEIVLPRPRQHYNVLFIKAPATTVVNTPSTALGGQTQEKTLVYVVSDKKRIENRIEVPEVDQAKLQKPEVFFIKHNKPTEVINSKIKYQTVDAIQGAENGAVNGVANRVSHDYGGVYADDTDNSIQTAILSGVQQHGVQGGINVVNNLVKTGTSIGNAFGGLISGNSGSSAKQFDAGYGYGGSSYGQSYDTGYGGSSFGTGHGVTYGNSGSGYSGLGSYGAKYGSGIHYDTIKTPSSHSGYGGSYQSGWSSY